MKERQRWTAEEDALLRAYVKQFGPREWNLVSQRMNKPLNRDAKSCLERWKNYLKPGIQKGSLTEEEKSLVIRLQQIYGNKWKKIAAQVPGRTAKRLGKWWEVFKEKQQREKKEFNKTVLDPIDDTKYDHLLENFAEKLVKERPSPSYLMPSHPSAMLPSWLSNSNSPFAIMPPSSPSVTLSLSPSTVAASPLCPWLQPEKMLENASPAVIGNVRPCEAIPCFGDNMLVYSELVECCKELEEGHRAWSLHRKEAAWRLKRVELQMESEKVCRMREKMEEFEAKINALWEEQMAALDRIDAEYREQLAELRRDAETKEQKLAARPSRLSNFLEQIGCKPKLAESTVR